MILELLCPRTSPVKVMTYYCFAFLCFVLFVFCFFVLFVVLLAGTKVPYVRGRNCPTNDITVLIYIGNENIQAPWSRGARGGSTPGKKSGGAQHPVEFLMNQRKA